MYWIMSLNIIPVASEFYIAFYIGSVSINNSLLMMRQWGNVAFCKERHINGYADK